jgi:hypothetical protein
MSGFKPVAHFDVWQNEIAMGFRISASNCFQVRRPFQG